MNFILFHFQYFKNKFPFFLVDTIYHKDPIGSAEMKRGISMFNNIGGSALYLNLLHLFNRESGRDFLHQNPFFASHPTIWLFIIGVAGFLVSEEIDEEKLRIVVNAD